MRDPTPLAPTMPLEDQRIPLLCLIDALHAAGYRAVSQRTVHERRAEKEYDSRPSSRKRGYLQCVLNAEKIWQRGTPSFRSGETAAHYQALLADQQPPRRANQEPQGSDGTPGHVVDPTSNASRPGQLPHAAGSAMQARDTAECDLDPDLAPDLLAPAAVPNLHQVAPGVADLGAGEDSASDTGAARSEAEAEGADGIAPDRQHEVPAMQNHVPESIDGMPVSIRAGKHDSGWNYHARVQMQCPAGHAGCSRSRSCALQTERFGPGAAVLFLRAWAARSASMSAAQHRAYRPTVDDLLSFMNGGAAQGHEE